MKTPSELMVIENNCLMKYSFGIQIELNIQVNEVEPTKDLE